MARSSTTRRLCSSCPLCLALLLSVGCGQDEAADAGAGRDLDVSATDAGGPGLDTVAGADLAEADTERLCTPGAARCRDDDRAAEECDEEGRWVVVACAPNELCYAGECGLPESCEPLSVDECLGFDRYRGCNEVGTEEGEWAVPFNLTCVVSDQGEAELIPRLCFQGETRCDGEQVLERCAASGLAWEYSTNCFEDDETTLCDDGQCVTLCQYIEKRDTYVGCEYWAVDLDNFFRSGNDAFHAQFAVAISNPGESLAADITIEAHDRVLAEGRVEPGAMHVFELPYAEIEGTMHGLWGYRIKSTMPIVAYQFNPLENFGNFSNDASLLLPTSSLGTEYFVMTRRQTFENAKGTITIVATQEGETEISTIRLPDETPENPLVTLAGTDIPPYRGGESFSFTLEQFEVLNLETNAPGADFTGTYIESNRPVAVFGGSELANAPNDDSCVYRQRQEDWVCAWDRETPCYDEQLSRPNIELCSLFITCCGDHIEHQLLPLFAWGRELNAARSAPRGDEADVWRILAGYDDTEIRLIGIPFELGEPLRTEYTLQAGEWIEFESRVDFEIEASQPILVGQFLAAEFAPAPDSEPNPIEYPVDAGTGDPAFILTVPREQYRSDYIFLVPAQYAHNWVSIVVPTGTSVTHTDENGQEILAADLFEPFAGGEWAAYRHELLTEGYHRLTAEVPFGAMVHGYDQFVSYGYPAGLDVKKINPRHPSLED